MPPLPGLERQRLRRALSQRDLSRRSGVARSTIVKIENGRASAQPRTMRKLALALSCAPEDLLIQSA